MVIEKRIKIISTLEKLRFLYVQSAMALEELAILEGPRNQDMMFQANRASENIKLAAELVELYVDTMTNEITQRIDYGA